tara:strand:+ start:71 stop:202 length:132 start_codon:yes stop_codon:yes gene_type:complete
MSYIPGIYGKPSPLAFSLISLKVEQEDKGTVNKNNNSINFLIN